MAKTNKASKKQPQKRGVDFKKIKRKIGRKLPPPKNATNTEIKSKAIVLPEQRVAADKEGLHLSKKGLTLKDILQQTSHHNAKVRKDALVEMRDLFLKHPGELNLHRYAVVEKIRERISDDDKAVRETLYQLLKSVILPSCKEDNQGPFVSLVMAYIFNAMTHLAIDIRLMAFKFIDLVIQHYPPTFLLYSEKILQNYKDILQKNQLYLQEKAKLKNVLAGLVNCLVLLPSNKREADQLEKGAPENRILHSYEPEIPTSSAEFPDIGEKLKDLLPVLVNCFQDFIPSSHSMQLLDAQSLDCISSILQSIDLVVRFLVCGIHDGSPESQCEVAMWDQSISLLLLKKLFGMFPLNPTHELSERDDDRYFILNIAITKILLNSSECICPAPSLLDKFLAFMEHALLEKNCGVTRSGRTVREKHIPTLIQFIPKLLSQVTNNWKSRLLLAFTTTFQHCYPESFLKLACLTAIEEMLISRKDMLYLDANDSELLEHQITWLRELPLLLIQLGDKHPSSSKVVLRLLLCVGQSSLMNSVLALEYDNIQSSLEEFYSKCQEGKVHYGPFMRLPRDSQELSVCCLYYFSHLNARLLKSIASCCLCPELDTSLLFRMIEVMHSAYKAGHIQIADHISFFITLVSCFKVFPENICSTMESDLQIQNHGTFKSLTRLVCSYLSQIGDNSLVFMILERVIMDQILLNPPLENACAMLRMLIFLDSKTTRLSEQSIITLGNFLPRYLLDIVNCAPEGDDNSSGSTHIQTRRYYLLPCFFLFDKSHRLLNFVLNTMASSITEAGSLSFSDTHYGRDCSSRLIAIISVLLMMNGDAKVKQMISLSKGEVDSIVQNICYLQSSEEINLTTEERRRIQCAVHQLKKSSEEIKLTIQERRRVQYAVSTKEGSKLSR